MNEKYTIIDTSTQVPSSLVIKVKITWKEMETYHRSRLAKIAEGIEVDGFRKGKAPHEAVEAQVGQMDILQQAAQDAIGDVYPAMVIKEGWKVIGYPDVALTKIAHGSDLEFTLTTACMPKLELGDYKSLAAQHLTEELDAEVSDEEFNQAVERLQNMYARSATESEEKCDGEEPQTNKELPALTDEFVGQLGEYASVAEFNEKFRSELREQKLSQARAKRREAMIKAIADAIDVELPDILVEAEKDKMLAAIQDDISRMGLEYSAWLEHSGKSEEEMRAEMSEDAHARAKADLVLKSIAKKENIRPDATEVDKQVLAISEVHKDVGEENIRAYVDNIYLNEAVLQFLEDNESKK